MSEPELALQLALRSATVADASAIAEIYNAYAGNGYITFDGEGKSVEHFAAKLAEDNPAEAWIVAVSGDGTLAGYGALFPWSDRCGYKTTGETSVYLRPDSQRRGIGSAIKRALIDRACELGYHHLVAKLVADNGASLEYNLRFGYEIVGTQREAGFVDGRWHDVIIMQLLLD